MGFPKELTDVLVARGVTPLDFGTSIITEGTVLMLKDGQYKVATNRVRDAMAAAGDDWRSSGEQTPYKFEFKSSYGAGGAFHFLKEILEALKLGKVEAGAKWQRDYRLAIAIDPVIHANVDLARLSEAFVSEAKVFKPLTTFASKFYVVTEAVKYTKLVIDTSTENKADANVAVEIAKTIDLSGNAKLDRGETVSLSDEGGAENTIAIAVHEIYIGEDGAPYGYASLDGVGLFGRIWRWLRRLFGGDKSGGWKATKYSVDTKGYESSEMRTGPYLREVKLAPGAVFSDAEEPELAASG